jgi:CNT family concentrative nucleoside transporter
MPFSIVDGAGALNQRGCLLHGSNPAVRDAAAGHNTRMSWLNLVSLFGCVGLGALAWLSGGCRRPLPWRTVLGSGLLMLLMGFVVFWVPQTRGLLVAINSLFLAVLDAGSAGALFLFGPLALNPGQATDAGAPSIGFVFGAQALPLVVFFAALMAVLYHWRALQPVVRWLGRLFRGTLRLSGAEALAGASNIFFGLESATTIRPYLERMTRSELLTVLTCCMATVASTTLGLYVRMLQDVFPQIAGHLISASVISIPAAVLTSKLVLPETGVPETLGETPALHESQRQGNTMAALAAGAWDGLKLAAGIATLLVAVLGVVALVDLVLVQASSPLAEPLGGTIDLRRILGWLFTPLAWLLGIETADLVEAGRLLGGRLVLTEIPVYQELAILAQNGELSTRSLLIVSYALCGFTHVASMGIFVGGITALAPSRRDDLAALGLRALLAATLATLLTGALAGLLFHGQPGLLGL